MGREARTEGGQWRKVRGKRKSTRDSGLRKNGQDKEKEGEDKEKEGKGSQGESSEERQEQSKRSVAKKAC